MNKKLIIAAALAASAVGGVAIAADALIGPRGPMAADTNGDGVISRAEYFTAAEGRFKRLDTNSDRKLVSSELAARRWGGKRGGPMLRPDGNGDGTITFEEATAAASARFKAQDANQDGKLTPAEAGPKGLRGDRRGMRGAMAEMMLDRVDTNNDGKISRDEMRAQADQRFDRMDTNKDGFIDKTETERMRGFAPGRRGPGGPGGPGDMPPPPPPPGDAGE